MFENIEKHIIFTVSNYFCSIYPCLSIKKRVFCEAPNGSPIIGQLQDLNMMFTKVISCLVFESESRDLELPSLCDIIIRKSF